MVGNGEFYRSLLEASDIELRRYSQIFFPQIGNGFYSDQDEVLERLHQMPQYDTPSFLLSSVVDLHDHDINVLLVPKDCPKIRESKYQATNELPPENETFIADTWNEDHSEFDNDILVLAPNFVEAEDIAVRKAMIKYNCPKIMIYVRTELVSPQEWVNKAKELIDSGKHLPDFIMCWGGLQAYADARMERLGIGNPLAINVS